MTNTPMTEAEFDDLAFTHSGDPAAWPEDRRAAAEQWLAQSDSAGRRLAQIQSLEAALSRAAPPDPAPSDALLARILSDAAAAAPAAAPVLSRRRRRGLWRVLSLDALSPAAACAASAAVGLWLGYAGPEEVYGVATDVLTLSEPVEVALLDGVGAAPFVDALSELEGAE